LKHYKPNWEEVLKSIKAPKLINYKPIVKSGENEAKKVLKDFINFKLENYAKDKNDPVKTALSNLSAYLHFGQISSLRVALNINKTIKSRHAPTSDLDISKQNFFEEMIIRKELSDNFCFYNKNYKNLTGAKNWAQKTLNNHDQDIREIIYTLEELEHSKTHDPAWNAAQKEMVSFGKMHGYMRMYWAKKILEWTLSPEKALEYAIYLNDKYSLDGYDPNGYVGILWSITGLHDKPWFNRPIFGQIRYMNYNGLKRKFKIERYIEKLQKH